MTEPLWWLSSAFTTEKADAHGAAITLNGQIWQGDEMIMEATPIN